jgi:hypothetical protein
MISIRDVFKTVGFPSHTYVERDNGSYENRLRSSIESEGNICLLTGPSKTGKTTLYNKVLQTLRFEPLLIRCDENLSADEFWKRGLEKVNFERISSRESSSSKSKSGTVKIGGEFGWKWLSKIIGEVNLGIESDKSEVEVREIILSSPSPDHLIPVLKELNYFLVVEDFHYLKTEVQKIIFQQWKIFVDNEVSVLIVGTTHHAVDIAFANKDLTGRIMHIELGTWAYNDLLQIISKGFNVLNLNLLPSNLSKIIFEESVGLPIITQSVCYQLFVAQNVFSINTESKRVDLIFDKKSVFNALHTVAIERYGQYSVFYDILSRGLRKRSHKHDAYKLILLVFATDPPAFSLQRHEIDERIYKVIKDNSLVPPQASINNTLRNLSKVQLNKDIELPLLEWSESQGRLFILEPAFLFYIRWKDKKSEVISFEDIANTILESLNLLNTIDLGKLVVATKKISIELKNTSKNRLFSLIDFSSCVI